LSSYRQRTVGSTKEVYSWTLDPVVTTRVTVIGQLVMLTFIDVLSSLGSDVRVVSANIDGATLRVRRDKGDHVVELLNAVAEDLGFTLTVSE